METTYCKKGLHLSQSSINPLQAPLHDASGQRDPRGAEQRSGRLRETSNERTHLASEDTHTVDTNMKIQTQSLCEVVIFAQYIALDKYDTLNVLQPWWLNYDQALDLQAPAQQVQIVLHCP